MRFFSERNLRMAALPFAALCVSAAADAQENLIIYKGSSRDAGITAASWGSGTVTPDRQVRQEGPESLKIVSQGMYQGASLEFETPFNLGPFIANKDSLLQFSVYLPEMFNASGGLNPYAPPSFGGPGGWGGRGRGRGRGGRGRGGFPGGAPGGGFGGGFRGGAPGGGGFQESDPFGDLPNHGPSPGGEPQAPPAPPGAPRGGFGGPPGGFGAPPRGGNANPNVPRQGAQQGRPMQNLRVVMLTTNGGTLEFLLPVMYSHGSDAWRQFNIPVSAIPGIKAEDAQIKEIRLFADEPTTMWLSGIRTITDTVPLAVAALENQSALPKNSNYRYTAKVTGGASAIRVTWDFDETDGLQEDRTGPSVTYAYHKPTDKNPDYIVTVTATDVYGIKPPAQRKFRIHVTL